ncbi:MAG: polyphosphate polymerase domain-containing protein [Oscillospiraceae bacterium]|nr:polyphosphate polymerase domain-containing protein [Oscillospiraceae bacterium]
MTAVFKREEIKYMLTEYQYMRFRQLIDEHMAVDRYGLTTIYSLYFDSDNDDMIRASINKPKYKEKIRLRSYGTPKGDDSMVFLELKKKYSGTVYKRRVEMSLGQADDYILRGTMPFESQIMKEIDFSVKHWQAYPKLLMCYDRIAMFGKTDPEIRMTFDFAIRCRRDSLNPCLGDEGYLLTGHNNVLLEIKISNAMPMWMAKALSEIRAYPVSYSKYGEFYLREIAGTEKQLGRFSDKIAGSNTN